MPSRTHQVTVLLGRLVPAVVVLYVGSYLIFHQARAEVWPSDDRCYVIFPQGGGRALYYVWRPLSYVDGRLIGMGAHIGPHR
jgi:hypothetical protein